MFGATLGSQPQLWQWTASDAQGKPTTYQTEGPDVSESAMLAHLRKHYPNLTITALKRIDARQFIPPRPDKSVSRHAYQCGAWDLAMRELGLASPERTERTQQPPRPRGSILDRYRSLRDGLPVKP